MRLDILSPKGQKTVEQEKTAIEIFHRHYPELQCVVTPKSLPAEVDAIVLKGGELEAVAEHKCREADLNTLRKVWRWEWLVTFDKIIAGRDIAMRLQVPFMGLLYLVPEDLLLVQTICDRDGKFLTQMRVETTETQRCVNGGLAERSNAFINMATAEQCRGMMGFPHHGHQEDQGALDGRVSAGRHPRLQATPPGLN